MRSRFAVLTMGAAFLALVTMPTVASAHEAPSGQFGDISIEIPLSWEGGALPAPAGTSGGTSVAPLNVLKVLAGAVDGQFGHVAPAAELYKPAAPAPAAVVRAPVVEFCYDSSHCSAPVLSSAIVIPVQESVPAPVRATVLPGGLLTGVIVSF